jgi:hypothetical protein
MTRPGIMRSSGWQAATNRPAIRAPLRGLIDFVDEEAPVLVGSVEDAPN